MRIQCDVCEKAEAALVCCADEAALCAACDSQVHAANKLAGKHQRLPLIPPGPNESPSCDICQEKTGWFFCVEDRALLCRGCDVSIHTSNTLASTHKRFLVTGLKVALNALSAQDFLDAQSQHSSHNNLSPQKTINTNNSNLPVFGASSSVSLFNRTPERFETRTEVDNGVEKRSGSTISDYLTESVPGWRVDELLNIPDLASGYTLADVQSSKADAANLGEFDWLADLSLFDEQTYAEAFHEVPEMTFASTMGYSKTAPTKGKAKLNMAIVPEADDSLLVPDMALPPAKRARTFFTL